MAASANDAPNVRRVHRDPPMDAEETNCSQRFDYGVQRRSDIDVSIARDDPSDVPLDVDKKNAVHSQHLGGRTVSDGNPVAVQHDDPATHRSRPIRMTEMTPPAHGQDEPNAKRAAAGRRCRISATSG